MLPIIEQHLAEIAALCRKYEVKYLELFGSAAREDFDPDRSDLDFVVDFLSQEWHGAADRWFGLQEGLEALFARKVDLVSLPDAKNPYFLQVANGRTV